MSTKADDNLAGRGAGFGKAETRMAHARGNAVSVEQVFSGGENSFRGEMAEERISSGLGEL